MSTLVVLRVHRALYRQIGKQSSFPEIQAKGCAENQGRIHPKLASLRAKLNITPYFIRSKVQLQLRAGTQGLNGSDGTSESPKGVKTKGRHNVMQEKLLPKPS